MRKITAILLILCVVLPSFVASVFAEDAPYTMGNPDTTDWFNWYWPDDAAAMGTAIDASMFLDAPAGKHGFLKTEGMEMKFDDGTPAKFWGCNVGINFALRNDNLKEDIPVLADRIVRCGYNLVRLHAMDLHTYGNLFGTENITGTRKLDPEQVDKVFYLISELKKRGVYIYLDLICYRDTSFADDEIPFGNQIAYKGYGFFDEYLIELQNEFATNYLTPVNPYTGLALKDDPAVAVISITNESGILGLGVTNTTMPNYYAADFQSKFNRFLENKYSSREELEKAWREDGRIGLREDEDFKNGTVVLTSMFEKENYSRERFSDIYEYLYDIQVKFFEVTYDHIKNTIGAKSLISCTSIGQTWGTLPTMIMATREVTDVYAQNIYKSHPTGLGAGSITPWISPTVRGGQELFQHVGVNRPANVPYFMTEWQACAPGHHAPEHWVMLAVHASMNHINPINYLLQEYAIPERNSGEISNDGFQSFPNAMMTSISPVAAMIFHRDNIEPFEDEYSKVWYKDEFFSKDTYDTPYSKNTFYNWHVTPWNVFPYGRSVTYYPELGDDVSEVDHVGLDNMYRKWRNNEPQSEQINWNQDTGLYRFQSDYTNAACGFIGGLTIDMNDCIFEMENQSATVALTSCNMETIGNTDRCLIALVGRSRNTGETMDDETASKITNGGTGPQILEAIKGYITLKFEGDVQIFALDSSGKRTVEVPFEVTEEGYKKFYADAKYETAYYEVVKTKGE